MPGSLHRETLEVYVGRLAEVSVVVEENMARSSSKEPGWYVCAILVSGIKYRLVSPAIIVRRDHICSKGAVFACDFLIFRTCQKVYIGAHELLVQVGP